MTWHILMSWNLLATNVISFDASTATLLKLASEEIRGRKLGSRAF